MISRLLTVLVFVLGLTLANLAGAGDPRVEYQEPTNTVGSLPSIGAVLCASGQQGLASCTVTVSDLAGNALASRTVNALGACGGLGKTVEFSGAGEAAAILGTVDCAGFSDLRQVAIACLGGNGDPAPVVIDFMRFRAEAIGTQVPIEVQYGDNTGPGGADQLGWREPGTGRDGRILGSNGTSFSHCTATAYDASTNPPTMLDQVTVTGSAFGGLKKTANFSADVSLASYIELRCESTDPLDAGSAIVRTTPGVLAGAPTGPKRTQSKND